MSRRPHSARLLPISFLLLFPAISILNTIERSAGAQEGYRISEVSFEGDSALSADLLTEQLLFPPTGWFGTTFLGDEEFRFSAADLEMEVRNLRRFYQTEGFPDAQIAEPVVKSYGENETVEITFSVAEGRWISVGATDLVIINPDTALRPLLDSLTATMTPVLTASRESRFRDDAIMADRDALLHILTNGGFPYARADYTISVRGSADTADVRWEVQPGPLCTFGSVEVTGAELYSEELITDRVAFSPGDRYSHRLMEKTQRDVYDLQLYRTVSVAAARTEERPSTLPVAINVRETSRYRTEIGVGYGRDEKLRYTGKVDVFGVFRTAGRLGIELRRSDLEPFTFLVSYHHPDFLGSGMRLSIDPFLRREDEPGYESKRVGYSLSFDRPLVGDLLGALSYTYEQVTLDRVPSVTLPPDFVTDYPKESVGLTLGYNSSRPLFSPREGLAVALSGRFSGIDLFYDSPYRYTTTILDVRTYTSPWKSLVTAFRLKMGTIISHDEPAFIPFEDRFYAGGSMSVRGWGRSLLGPLDAEGRPVGGSSILETGAEMRFPDGSPLSIALFLDAGNVWETPGTYKLNDLGYSGGVGVRYATPIGPVRLDIAHPVFGDNGPWQWWFSIGHAF